MRQLVFTCFAFVVAALVIVAMVMATRPDTARAEDILARVLVTPGASNRVGAYTWLEDFGIAIKLSPAPLSAVAPRLLAGDAAPEAVVHAGFWECGDEGVRALQSRLTASGASLESPSPMTFRPRGGSSDLAARSTRLTLKDGRRGMLVDFQHSGRNFALVLDAVTGQEVMAEQRRDEILRELVLLPGADRTGVAPLILDGRYACVLPQWRRDGERFYRETPDGWLGLRLFEVADTSYESAARLQLDLESRLEAAGFKRAGGSRPKVAGREAFIGEYFGNDGFVQRICYAQLNGGYLVAMMQAPEAMREALATETDRFVSSIMPLDIGGGSDRFPLFFGQVRELRVHAYQTGRSVYWGGLFNDGRQQPVLWREEGIKWRVQMTRRGELLYERAGEANSSRALNLLVEAESRALPLAETISGPVEIMLETGSLRATTTIVIR